MNTGYKLMKTLSCGILVIDNKNRILMFDANKGAFCDIPKGGQEYGETPIETAVRELKEETGLECSEDCLIELGHYEYNRFKDLYLFIWFVGDLDLNTLSTDSLTLKRADQGDQYVEKFYLFNLNEADNHMCDSLKWLYKSSLRHDIELEIARLKKAAA